MKIYIADENDTLRKIARKTACPLEQLFLFNPGIQDPDLNLAGRNIHLSETPSYDQCLYE